MVKSIREKIIYWSFISLFLSVPLILLGTRTNDPVACTADDSVANIDKSGFIVDASGTTLLDNKPFFPFGFYHVSWQTTSVERRKHLQAIAAAGFNTIHTSFNTTDAPKNKSARIEEYAKFLQEADALGIKVITEFDPKERQMLIEDLKGLPSILGWNIADDVDNGRLTPAKVLDFHCKLKKADPRHLTYISGYSESNLGNFVNTADAVGVQGYPVGDNRDRPFGWLNYIVSIADEAADADRLIIGNVQAFRWDKDNPVAAKNPEVPTFDQVRNMTYQSLVGGAKGIIYFTAYAEDWNILEHPQLWSQMRTLVPEINQLKPMLLRGKLVKQKIDPETVLAGVWTLEDRQVAIILNTSETETTKVSLDLSGSTAQSMFAPQNKQVKLNQGRLTTTLEPLEVRIYELRP